MNNEKPSTIEALKSRFSTFFTYKKKTTGYTIIKTVWCFLFFFYFIATSIVEFLVMTIVDSLGYILGKIPILGFILGPIFGLLHFLFYYLFMLLAVVWMLPDLFVK